MIAFVSITAVMVAAALAWVLLPLLRGTTTRGVEREASNVAILRDQLAELRADLSNGTIPREQYEQARRELETRVLEESKASTGEATRAPSIAGAWTAAIVAGALPIAALLLYVSLGTRVRSSARSRSIRTTPNCSPTTPMRSARRREERSSASRWTSCSER